MLVGNGALVHRQPLRLIGGGSAGDLTVWGRAERFNRMAGAFSAVLGGLPYGYGPPVAWTLPRTAGAIGCSLQIQGLGSLDITSLAGGLNAEASLTGSGTVSNALLGLIVSLQASLSGSGHISLATIVGAGNLASSLSGSGHLLDSAMQAIAWLISAMSGAGTLEATMPAKGNMECSITSTGDLLTTANVADIVWGFIVEQGLTADQAIKLMVAALAGKVSGAGTSTITIQNAGDGTKDRIVATVDGQGNRTDITYDLD